MAYGIFDKFDGCWIGNDSGPAVIERYDVARIGAQMACVQVGWPEDRCEAREINTNGLRLRDKVDAKMTPLRALQVLEGGTERESKPVSLVHVNGPGWIVEK